LPPALGPGVIVVASLRQAWRHKRKFDAVLTLEDPVCRSADQLRFHQTPKPPHLVLAFEDVDDDSLGVQVASHEQVDQALAFARANVGGSLLIHCRHGVGRSAAMALAVFADRLGAHQEDAALNGLLAIRPQATPNLVVVKLADAVLERGGRLVAAVQAWEAASPHMVEVRAMRRAFLAANPHLYSWRTREV
jgi:predicted protein tyrosine phosphatase